MFFCHIFLLLTATMNIHAFTCSFPVQFESEMKLKHFDQEDVSFNENYKKTTKSYTELFKYSVEELRLKEFSRRYALSGYETFAINYFLFLFKFLLVIFLCKFIYINQFVINRYINTLYNL